MPLMTRDQMYNVSNQAILRPFIWEFFGQFEKDKPIFSLYKEDGYEGTHSLRKLYMQYCVEDPTEVTFAEQVFGDVHYWLIIREQKFIEDALKQYRREADVRRKALAFKSIVKEVKSNGRSAFTAAKFLIDEPWAQGNSVAEKKKIAKGKAETTQEAYETSQAVEDFKRLMKAN